MVRSISVLPPLIRRPARENTGDSTSSAWAETSYGQASTDHGSYGSECSGLPDDATQLTELEDPEYSSRFSGSPTSLDGSDSFWGRWKQKKPYRSRHHPSGQSWSSSLSFTPPSSPEDRRSGRGSLRLRVSRCRNQIRASASTIFRQKSSE